MLDDEAPSRTSASQADDGGPIDAADRPVALRDRGGLNARDIAPLLDATPQTISRWQTGKGEPMRKLGGRLSMLEAIVSELAVFYPHHRRPRLALCCPPAAR